MEEKTSLLYASPFPPLHSGISDYSVILVKALSERFDITLYTDSYNIDSACGLNSFKVKKHGLDKIDFDSYDYKIYNIGNQPDFHGYIYDACLKHPGLVIMHDFSLYYLFCGYHSQKGDLYSKIYELYGMETFLSFKEAIRKAGGGNPLAIKTIAKDFPLNFELLRSNNKFMVHSDFTKGKIQLHTKNKTKKINHICLSSDSQISDKSNLLEKYNFSNNTYIIASFGIIAPTKLNDIACEVIKRNAATYQDIVYLMVGEGDFADIFIDNKKIFKTGYVSLEDFDNYISACDLILNLRYPSMGETSGTLIRALQLGKCCIINDDGWFHEIPDNCAIKIGTDNIEEELERSIKYCLSNKDLCDKIGRNAKEYIEKEYDSENIVCQIEDFLKER